MSLICLAQLFTVKAREQLNSTAPLLTPRDITELLDRYLPRKNRSEAEVIAQIKHRHQRVCRYEDVDIL